MVEYDWVDSKLACTSLVLSIEAATSAIEVEVSDPLEWLILPV